MTFKVRRVINQVPPTLVLYIHIFSTGTSEIRTNASSLVETNMINQDPLPSNNPYPQTDYLLNKSYRHYELSQGYGFLNIHANYYLCKYEKPLQF